MRFSILSLFLALSFGIGLPKAWGAQEVPQTLTFDGRAYSDTASTVPMLDSIAAKIQILSATQTCILYEETQTIDTTSSNGYFNIQIGSITTSGKRSGNDSGNTMSTVFSNRAVPITGKLLSNGAACSYTPGDGEKRYVRIEMTPASDGVTRVISPNMALDSVPNAMVAETLQGLTPGNFIQVNNSGSTVLTQANLESIFTSSNLSNLSSLISVPASNYVHTTSNGSATLPSVSGDPSSGLSTGQVWFDSVANVLKYYDGGAVRTLQASGTSLIAPTIYGSTSPSGNLALESTSDATKGVITLASTGGRVGVGVSPRSAGMLDVNGTVLMKPSVDNGSGVSIDFSTGNLQHTTASCGAFTLNNMQDGGSYTLAVKGTTSGTCAFTAYSGNGTGALTVHLPTDHGATTASTHTLYSFLVMGSDVYVTWMPGM